ncbi:10812_t:CDS:1, partial [Gigaspora margarita]
FSPRESCNRHVSFESQYGICVICLTLLILPRAEIKELDEALEHIIFVDGAKNK